MAIDVSVREISTVKYRLYRHVIKDPIQIDINSLCTIPELWNLKLKFFPDVPGSDKCRRF